MQTWDECREQLEACAEQSEGLFFLSLQGNKYGYRPIPRQLPASLHLGEHAAMFNVDYNDPSKRPLLRSMTLTKDHVAWADLEKVMVDPDSLEGLPLNDISLHAKARWDVAQVPLSM